MRKDMEPPEFASNPLEMNLDGMYRQAYARAGISRQSFARIVTTFALGVGFLTACKQVGIVSASTTGPGEGTQNSTVTEVAPTDTDPIPTEITPTFTKTPTETPTQTETPKPSWQTAIETQDPQDQFFKIVDGQPTIDQYDTTAVESIVLVQESVKSIETTDGLNPNILTAQDAEGNKYAFNPDHGWFALPEVQMDYADLSKYTEVEEDYFYDGRNNIVRALNYFYSSEKISPDAHPVYWITARNDNLLCLSFFPVGKTGVAQRLWPTEYLYSQEGQSFVFSGFYKVNLKTDGYIYAIDRTIKIDSTHTSGFSHGFDKGEYEYWATHVMGSGRTVLKLFIDAIKQGGLDFVIILPPPEQLVDGTPISFDPNTASLDTGPNPIVAGLQGPRGSLISLFSPEDQQKILGVLIAHQHESLDIVNPVTAPLTDPSLLVKLANYILLTTVGAP